MGFRSDSLVTIAKSLPLGTPGGRSDSADASRPSPSSSVSGLSLSSGSTSSHSWPTFRSATSLPSEEPTLLFTSGVLGLPSTHLQVQHFAYKCLFIVLICVFCSLGIIFPAVDFEVVWICHMLGPRYFTIIVRKIIIYVICIPF